MTRLIQLSHSAHGRRVALVDGNDLRLLTGFTSVYRIAASGKPLIDMMLVPWLNDRLTVAADEGKYLYAFLHGLTFQSESALRGWCP